MNPYTRAVIRAVENRDLRVYLHLRSESYGLAEWDDIVSWRRDGVPVQEACDRLIESYYRQIRTAGKIKQCRAMAMAG